MANVNVSMKCKEKSVSNACTHTYTLKKNRLLAVMPFNVQPRDTLQNLRLTFPACYEERESERERERAK